MLLLLLAVYLLMVPRMKFCIFVNVDHAEFGCLFRSIFICYFGFFAQEDLGTHNRLGTDIPASSNCH